MNIKKIIAGEQMPDKNDPRYKEQYEREVEAGRKFANKTKLTLLVMKIQSWANVHRVGFLVIVFGFVISLFALNIINMIRYYKARTFHIVQLLSRWTRLCTTAYLKKRDNYGYKEN